MEKNDIEVLVPKGTAAVISDLMVDKICDTFLKNKVAELNSGKEILSDLATKGLAIFNKLTDLDEKKAEADLLKHKVREQAQESNSAVRELRTEKQRASELESELEEYQSELLQEKRKTSGLTAQLEDLQYTLESLQGRLQALERVG